MSRHVMPCAVPFVLAVAVASLAAQSPSAALGPGTARSFVAEPVDGAAAVAIGFVWPHDAPREEFAGLVVHSRAALVQERLPTARLTVHVDAEVAVLVAVLPAVGAEAAVPALLAALDDRSALDAERFARVRAHYALRLDGEAHVLPGNVLARRVGLRRVLPQTPPDAHRVLETTPESLTKHDVWRQPALVAARGAIRASLAEMLAAVPCEPATAVAPERASVLPPGRGREPHSRIDQPFVAAAFVVPPEVAREAMILAAEVAAERAAQAFRVRGSELRAGAPFVRFQPLAGDDVVMFCRRGEDYVALLPGEVAAADAAAEAAATAAELERFLATLRDVPVGEAELSRSCTRWLATHGLLPPTVASCDAAVLGGQLRAALLARWRGLDANALRAVEPGAVTAALRSLVRPDAGYWHTLLPTAVAQRGWRRR